MLVRMTLMGLVPGGLYTALQLENVVVLDHAGRAYPIEVSLPSRVLVSSEPDVACPGPY